jgi:enterobactin synthetase component D / holo-[acyl-carrier protein] synthase
MPVGEPSATNESVGNPAQLSSELGALFPAGVVAVELTTAAPRAALTATELTFISHCAQKRIDDFTRGRACAHRGLRELGLEEVSLLAGDKREPLWPAGIIGSITHTSGFAAAVVGRRSSIEALGIDCEVVDSVGADLWERICTPGEQERLRRLPEAEAKRSAALIFAAKEAFYKCQFPLSREWVGFEEVNIEESGQGTFRIVPQVDLPVTADWVAALVGRYQFRGPWVVTGVTALISARL